MSAAPVSPELALVDPDCRDRALALLPPVIPWSFLDLPPWVPPARPAPPRVVAVGAYLVTAAARTLLVDALLVAVLAAAVAALQLV